MVDSPSGGAPSKDPRRDLADTEGYSGGNSFSWSLLMFLGDNGYMYEEGVRRWTPEGPTRVGAHPALGGAPGTLVAASLVS